MPDDHALHYSTHAIEDLETPLANMKRNGFPRSARNLGVLAQLMREALKFNLPDRGELIAIQTLGEAFAEFIKLPFPAVCLEAPYPPSEHTVPVYEKDDNFKEHASSKRISVAWTQEVRDRYPVLCPYGERVGFYVASVYYDDTERHWLACPLLNFVPDNPVLERNMKMPSSGYQGREHAFLLEQGAIKPSNTGYEVHTTALLPELIEAMAQEMGSQEDALARFSIDTRDETATAIAFCLTVNASNIGRERIEPPAKLNKKRLASGRVPFYESWVLNLAKRAADGRPEEPMGVRESPRLHLRSGHLRRLGPDRITFVRATTVGSLP